MTGVTDGDLGGQRALELRLPLARQWPRQRRGMPGARSVVVEGHTLTVVWLDGPDAASLIEASIQLADELSTGGWEQVAQDLGLELDERGRLVGQVRGVPIRAVVEGDDTVVTATTEDHGITARHGKGRPIGNPVLDSLIAASGERVRERLDDEAAGALLAVVHAYPGSTVTPERIVLRHPGLVVDELPELIERVVLLAEALRQASPDPGVPIG